MNKSTRLTPLEAANKIRDDNNGQVVLVLQGGGALGAYQGGVYQALHEAGIEPDWIIGTSIGAINASVIAGNKPEDRLVKLREFWRRVERADFWGSIFRRCAISRRHKRRRFLRQRRRQSIVQSFSFSLRSPRKERILCGCP